MNKKLRLRFIDDLSYPVSVVEDPYFDYQLSLCPGGVEDWERLKEGIEKEYEGNPELFLQAYYEVREKMIQDLQGSERFKDAVVPEVDRKEVARSKDIYNEEYAGRKKVYVSIDLKKANVQAFAHTDPELFGWNGEDVEEVWQADVLWKNFVVKHTGKEKKVLRWYCEKSKYLRQVVFGNVKPKKQIGIEKWMVWEQAKEFMKVYPEASLVMASADEVIFEMEEEPGKLVTRVPWVDTKIQPFKLTSIPFETGSGNTIRIYKREMIGTGKVDYKCIPRNYYPQIWCLLNGEECKEEGLAFYYEKEIACFIRRLKIKEGE